jgi:diacylglycerol kinase (ATP)
MSKKDKNTRAKLIVNPGAGKASETAAKLKLVTGYLEKDGMKVDVAFARPKEKATPIARKAVKNGYKAVIAMGGDGTIEAVMRGMIGSKTRLGIIPTGTANNIAMSLGIPKDLQEACTLIVSAHTAKFDMGQVKTGNGKKFYFFEMATVGLSAAVYPHANKVTNGKLADLKETALTFLHHKPNPKVYLTLNDESEFSVETMLVMVSNTPVFGRNFRVAPGASLNDGLLDISVYPNFSKTELLGYYAAVMNGGYSGNGKVQHYRANKIKIKTTPKLDTMADGVDLGKGTLKIKSLPGALRVITAQEQPNLENLNEDSPTVVQSHEEAKPDTAEKSPVQPEEKNTGEPAAPATLTVGIHTEDENSTR